MKKPQILLLGIVILLLSSCSQTETVVHQPLDPLYRFFHQCEIDINNVADVITQKDIIKNLYHLHRMNAGGKKYYILERENITEMINAVTQEVYSDYIILTSNGTVVYTKKNDDIFNKNVKGSHLINTPVSRCFHNSNTIYIEDASKISNSDPNYYYYISKKITSRDGFPGMIILQIDAAAAARAIDSRTKGVNAQGNIKLSRDISYIDRQAQQASLIDLDAHDADTDKIYTIDTPIALSYRYFNYRNISWVLITEQ